MKLKNLKLTVLLFFAYANSNAQSIKAELITGNWMDLKKQTIVHCYKQDGKYYGKLLWAENLEAIGKPLPPDEQHWINMIVMKGFEYGDSEWANGTIYNPKTDKTYSSFIRLINNDTLEVTGYIFFRFLSESELFIRVNNQSSN